MFSHRAWSFNGERGIVGRELIVVLFEFEILIIEGEAKCHYF